MNAVSPQDSALTKAVFSHSNATGLEHRFNTALQSQNIPTHVRRSPDSPSAITLRRDNPFLGVKIHADRFAARDSASTQSSQSYILTAPIIMHKEPISHKVPEALSLENLTLETQPASVNTTLPVYGNRSVYSSYEHNNYLYDWLEDLTRQGYDIRSQEYEGSASQEIKIGFILTAFNDWMQLNPDARPETFFVMMRALSSRYPASGVTYE